MEMGMKVKNDYHRDIFKQNPWVLCPDLSVASQGRILLTSDTSRRGGGAAKYQL